VDFAHPASDLSRYKLVIAPNLYLVKEGTAENINRYVENGGNLVMSFFSGLVDEHDHARLGGYPAPFREMLGLVVEEYAPYFQTDFNTIRTSDHKQFTCSLWSDIIRLQSAEAIAEFEEDYYKGTPAVTRNPFGKGTAFYVGTVPDADGMDWLINEACREADVRPVVPGLPEGVELVRRTNGTHTWLLALNYSNEELAIPLQQASYELLSETSLDTSLRLGPGNVAIVQLPLE
jgi:beta-galactosidase